jgi:hypothetical protein
MAESAVVGAIVARRSSEVNSTMALALREVNEARGLIRGVLLLVASVACALAVC